MLNLLKNKMVLVMGLGLLGGGVAVTKWLVKQGARVIVTDLKTEKELKPSLGKLKPSVQAKIKFVLGQHQAADFKKADLVIRNPGVPKESKYLKIAQKAGVPIENEASLFFKYCPGEIIGVTGTRGKSTTAALIYKLLINSRRHSLMSPPAGKVWLAGLPHKPMLEILDKVKFGDLVVLELSSWQLEILGQHRLTPYVAIITNIYPDHLNRYSGMKSYITAKKNIFYYQSQKDLAVLNLDNKETKKLGQQVPSQRFWFSKKYFSEQNGCFIKNGKIIFRRHGQEKKLARLPDIKLAGQHNLENILAALTVAGIYRLPEKKIKSVLKKFSGLVDRLEVVKTVKGVKYINDTTATVPQATIAALKTLANKKKNIILIAGGSAKNIPAAEYRQLAKLVKQTCRAVILFSGKGSDQFARQLKAVSVKSAATEIGNMKRAVKLAKKLAKKGDIVLLSPACASFNLFLNEFDRGRQFKKVVNLL